jgi:hypothetical protein
MSTQLEKFTKAKEALEAHIEANKALFDDHQKLVFAVIDAENELRDYAAEKNEGETNGKYTVVVTPQTQTWGDVEVLKEMLASGKIGQDFYDKVVKTEKRPARISIKENK